MALSQTTQKQYKRERTWFETDLTDAEWELLRRLLPPPSPLGWPRRTDLREVTSAIQQMLGTGCQRRTAPSCFPPFATVREGARGPQWGADGGRDRQSERQTAESGGPSGCDAGKRIKGRRRHIAADTGGNPPAIRELLSRAPEVRKIWAGGGYSGPEPTDKLKRLKLANHIEIVGKPEDIKGFTVLRRRRGGGADLRLDVVLPAAFERL